MDSFLQQTAQAGRVSQKNQTFTVSGEKARGQFLASVPPDEPTVFKGMLFLADALAHLGIPLGIMHQAWRISPSNNCFQLTHRVAEAGQVLKVLNPDWLRQRFDHPFSSKAPLDLAWDRAWLRLMAAGAKLTISYRGNKECAGWRATLCKDQGLVFENPGFQPLAELVLTVRDFVSAPSEFMAEDRLRLGRVSPLILEQTGGVALGLGYQARAGGWFDYRSHRLCLHERVFAGQGIECLIQEAGKPAIPHLGLQLLERPSFWKRLKDPLAMKILSRRWLFNSALGPSEHFRARAVFALCLDERPGFVDLFCHGHSLESVTLREMPRGFYGLVCWPDLNSEIWGQRYVRDQQWEAVQAWICEQCRELQQDLLEHQGYLISQILDHHSKRVYRKEVEKKVRDLWFSGIPQPASHPSTSLTPEECASRLRSKLGW